MAAQYTLKAKVLNGENITYEGHPAEDLKLFVRVHFKDHTHLLATEAIENNPNPVWNIDLELAAHDPQKDELVVELVHQDINKEVPINDPILVSIANLPVDKNAAQKEELELKKDDQPVGKLNIEFSLYPREVSSEKYTGPVLLRVNVTQASGITEMHADDDEAEDTYLSFLLEGHDPSETIKSIVNQTSDDPTWNQSFSIICNDPYKDVVNVKMTSGNVTIIENEKIVLGELEPYTREDTNYSFEVDGSETGGNVGLDYQTFDLASLSKKPVHLKVKVNKGKELERGDADDANPFVKISVGDKEVTTDVKNETLDPEWNQEFEFDSTNPMYDNLKIQLFHKDASSDEKMMDDIVLPIRDIRTPQDTLPIAYDFPIKLEDKPVGTLCLEILAKGECLAVKPATMILQFTVEEANFNGKPVHITYGLGSKEEDEPKECDLNKRVSVRCDEPENDSLVVVFDDPESQDNLCDLVRIPLNQVGPEGICTYDEDVSLEGEPAGHVKIFFCVKDGKKMAEEEPEVKTRDAPIIQDDEYCDFLWGTYGSSYSTSFTGYSNCTPLSSTISDAEIKYHHRHPVLDKDATVKPKRRTETLSGEIRSVELTSQNEPFVVGDQYYATAILYGKSSRNSSKFPAIKSDAVQAQDANKLSFNNLTLNFDSKLKKGDYIEVNLYHQNDNKQVAKSTIALEKVDPSEEAKSNTFPLNEYKLVKNPAQIGTLEANLKHTVQFQ